MNVTQKSTQDVHAFVTRRMVDQLDLGSIPWHEHWEEQPQYMNGRQMDYLNVLLLGPLLFPRKVFFTKQQLTRNKISTKRGEKGYTIVGVRHGQVMPTLYCSQVFHVSQLQGMHDDLLPALRIVRNPTTACEAIVSGMPKLPRIIADTHPAYYSLKSDTIIMPEKVRFAHESHYYSSLFYAIAESTAHPSRRNRDTAIHRYADDPLIYSTEQLICEMVTGYLCNYTNIPAWHLSHYHGNPDGWHRKIQTDTTMVVTAAFFAQEAINYILNRNPLLNPIQTGVYVPNIRRQ